MRQDIPTCRLIERLGDIRARVLAAGIDTAKGEAKEAAAGSAAKVFQATSVVGEKIGAQADGNREVRMRSSFHRTALKRKSARRPM